MIFNINWVKVNSLEINIKINWGFNIFPLENHLGKIHFIWELGYFGTPQPSRGLWGTFYLLLLVVQLFQLHTHILVIFLCSFINKLWSTSFWVDSIEEQRVWGLHGFTGKSPCCPWLYPELECTRVLVFYCFLHLEAGFHTLTSVLVS